MCVCYMRVQQEKKYEMWGLYIYIYIYIHNMLIMVYLLWAEPIISANKYLIRA